MQLYIVSNNGKVNERLDQELGSQHALTYISEPTGNYANYDAIIIVEPYSINGQYLSIADLWHSYLRLHAPSTKLIVAGFMQLIDDPNFLPLLALNSSFDLDAFVGRAKLVSEQNEVGHLGNGYDKVSNKLKLFFKGHSQEGIIDAISKIRQVLNNAELSLHGSEKLKIDKEPFIKVWQGKLWAHNKKIAFQHFYNRWYNYKDYFKPIPLHIEIQEAGVENFISGLHKLFSYPRKLKEPQLLQLEQSYRDLNPFNQIGDMVTLFRSLNTKYINPEYAGHVLLIDDDEDFHQQMKIGLHQFTFSSIYNEEGLEELMQQVSVSYNIILLDLGLDDSDKLIGLDWLPKLRQKFPTIPICIVTAHNTRNLIHHTVYDEHANFFFAKSVFDTEKWTTVLINLLAGRIYSFPEVLLFNQSSTWEDKPVVLVIEDEDDDYQQVAKLSSDYQFVRASTINQAEDILKIQTIDLILLDLYFKSEGQPVKQGLDFITYLETHYPDIPLVVTSKDSSLKTRGEIGLKNVKKFLFKLDFDAIKWLDIIKTLVKIKKEQERLNTL